jgi:hypothetical protein
MTSQMFVDAAAFSASSVVFNPPKLNKAGGKNVTLTNKDTRKQLALSTPLMLTWGMNEFRDEATGKVSYDLSLQFPSDGYPNPEASDFLEKLVEMERMCKAEATKKAKDWFNKPTMSPEVVDALWTPMLRYKKDPATGMPDTSSAPTLRVKIPFWEDSWKIELYDTEGGRLYPGTGVTPMQLIPKLTNLALIIQSGGIWFANGKFGTTWRLVQGVVKPRASLFGSCHIKLNTDQKKTLEAQADREDEEESAEFEQTVVVDSDDEGDAGEPSFPEATEPAPAAPEPVKKKKRVVKKLNTD